MDLNRRDSAKLMLASAASVAAAHPAQAFLDNKQPPNWPAKLQFELDSHLVPNCDGKMTLTVFDMAERRGRVIMACVIRLDWPPGTRTRLFDASGDTADATFRALLNKALFSFAKAWPGCVV